MKRLKILFASLIACVCFAFTACGLNISEADYNSAAKIAGGDMKASVLSVKNTHGNSCAYTAKKFEGWDTVWSKSLSEDAEITVTVSLAITAGKAKIVLIAANGSITTLIECTEVSTENDATQTLSLKSGRNKLKLVALASQDLDMTLTVDC